MNSDDKKVHTLHRYFIWADKMKEHFEHELEKAIKSKTKRDPNFPISIEEFLYMSLWYAELYVVVEGWKSLKLKDFSIEKLLKSKNVDLLKRYRNGAFHYQEKYFDKRFTELISKGEKPGEWVRKLHQEFSRYFLDWFKSRGITA